MRVATVAAVSMMLNLGFLVDSAPACSATGAGVILEADRADDFSGYAMPGKDGTVGGNWQHLDQGTGRRFDAQIVYLVCRHVDETGPGVPNSPNGDFSLNQAYAGGPARVFFPESGWRDGFWLDVVIKDHGEPPNQGGPDTYHITVRSYDGGSVVGPILYETSGPLAGGNIQLFPPNGGHSSNSSTLPAWVSFEP